MKAFQRPLQNDTEDEFFRQRGSDNGCESDGTDDFRSGRSGAEDFRAAQGALVAGERWSGPQPPITRISRELRDRLSGGGDGRALDLRVVLHADESPAFLHRLLVSVAGEAEIEAAAPGRGARVRATVPASALPETLRIVAGRPAVAFVERVRPTFEAELSDRVLFVGTIEGAFTRGRNMQEEVERTIDAFVLTQPFDPFALFDCSWPTMCQRIPARSASASILGRACWT